MNNDMKTTIAGIIAVTGMLPVVVGQLLACGVPHWLQVSGVCLSCISYLIHAYLTGKSDPPALNGN